MPWLGTAVPWFSLGIGLLLGLDGAEVSFVIDDLPVGPRRWRYWLVAGAIRFVLASLRKPKSVSRLARYGLRRRGSVDDEALIRRLAQMNAIWLARGQQLGTVEGPLARLLRRQLAISLMAVENCLDDCAPEVVVVPGGVFGSSGVWVACTRRHGRRISTFDSGGSGILMLASNGVAAQLQDIPRAQILLRQRNAKGYEQKLIEDSALGEVNRRAGGLDRFSSQAVARNPSCTGGLRSRYAGAILIALNSSWDTAALGLHAVFESTTQWLLDTIRYLLSSTDALIVVRQHPAERLPAARTSDDYRRLLDEHVDARTRLEFIAADAHINTYELLEHVGMVVVHTSTLGVEAALLGKVVVTAADAYYSDLGFVWKGSDLQSYRAHLVNGSSGRYEVTPEMRREAMLCYYLTQCCNWISSPFSPESFSAWSEMRLSELTTRENVRAIVECVRRGIPIAFLSHMARLTDSQ